MKATILASAAQTNLAPYCNQFDLQLASLRLGKHVLSITTVSFVFMTCSEGEGSQKVSGKYQVLDYFKIGFQYEVSPQDIVGHCLVLGKDSNHETLSPKKIAELLDFSRKTEEKILFFLLQSNFGFFIIVIITNHYDKSYLQNIDKKTCQKRFNKS